MLIIVVLACLSISTVHGQVYSPYVRKEGQIDTRTVRALASGVCQRAGAKTPREKAEAIWRFFLTDGRFVKPGFWYHIAGWAYEEPTGEVLDPVKLVNSYGFGLCYQIAPLLEAVWKAAGFEDARVWFLTGHTVTEVFYDGAYHYYDSDMMGYSTVGNGPAAKSRVASVRDLERNPKIILAKMLSPAKANPDLVDDPWYPADVRAGEIGGLAELFSTDKDNWLYAFRRHSSGHSMDFSLRPGEALVRYFRPEKPRLFYLPYAFDGAAWREFPREISEYQIRTEDGPHSQKDERLWGTGRLDYEPELSFNAQHAAVVSVASPYVIIDGAFSLRAALRSAADSVELATSSDGGKTWESCGSLAGSHDGIWRAEPEVLLRSEHGARTAISGLYGYLLRVSLRGAADVRDLKITTRFQLNPRTLPELESGANRLLYTSAPPVRRTELSIRLPGSPEVRNARWFEEAGQGFFIPSTTEPGAVTFEIASPDQAPLSGFEAGGRFLDLAGGMAPDKLTAEVRRTSAQLPRSSPLGELEWALAKEGPYRRLWSYTPEPRWLDGERISRLLRWPEVDERVDSVPAGTRRVFVRYCIAGLALDSVRIAVLTREAQPSSKLEITHIWREGGRERRHVETIRDASLRHPYTVDAGAGVTNEVVILRCPKEASR